MSKIASQILGVLKAAYNFFSGDAIILVAVIVAFVAGAILARQPGVANPIVAVVFIGIIVGGLVATLGRELAGRRQ